MNTFFSEFSITFEHLKIGILMFYTHVLYFFYGFSFHHLFFFSFSIQNLHRTNIACLYNNFLKYLFYSLSQAFSSVQFSSVAQLCPTLCNPMNRSTPGLPVHHQLPEFTQTHGCRVSDAIQPSHPRLSPSPPAPSPLNHHFKMP